ncbi:MAG: DUF748 domain-containing protein, partial [Puniceicoccales bacterium]
MADKPRRKWPKRVAITLASLLLFYTVFGFWGVPLLIRFVGLSKVNDTIAGEVKIDAIYFNPYSYRLVVDDVRGYTPDGGQALGLTEFRANFDFLSVFGDNLRFEEIYFGEPSLDLVIDEDGKVNIESALSSLQDQMNETLEEQVEKAKEDDTPFEIPVIEIGSLQVENASIGARIENLQQPFERHIENLSFVMKDIRTSPDRDNPYHFVFDTQAGEQVEVNGAIRLDPLSSDGSIRIDKIHLPDFYKLSDGMLGFDLAGGDMSFSAEYAFRPVRQQPELFIQKGHFLLDGLELRPAGEDEPFQTLERFEMSGIEVYLFRGAVSIERVDVINGMLKVVRDKAGVLNLMRYMLPEEQQAQLEQQVAQEQAQDKANRQFVFGLVADQQDIGLAFTSAWQQLQDMVQVTWDLKVATLHVENQNLVLVDEVPASPVNVTLGDINLDVSDMSNQGTTPFPFDLSLSVNESGKVTAKGTFTAEPPGTDFEYNVSGIDLSVFSPYVEASSPAVLHSAVLANKGTLKASFPEQALPTVETRFNVSLSDFDATVGAPLYPEGKSLRVKATRMANSGRVSANFPADGDPVVSTLADAAVDGFSLGLGDTEPPLSWAKLSVAGIDMATHPVKAKIDTITLEQFKADVVRDANGDLNLLALAPQQPTAPDNAEAAPAEQADQPGEKAPADTPSEAAPAVQPDVDLTAVGVNRFVLKKGTVKVTDESVKPASAFTLSQIEVDAGPFSLVPDAMTDMDTSLTLESGGAGTIAVKGSAQLMNPLANSTMNVKLDSVPMAGFSGYAVQAVGSPMTGGAFSGEFAYDIKTDELKGDNRMQIKKVRFGKRVPDSQAPKLPLELGIAVMENRNGIIDLNVPVDGSLDDPQFTLNHVVQTA